MINKNVAVVVSASEDDGERKKNQIKLAAFVQKNILSCVKFVARYGEATATNKSNRRKNRREHLVSRLFGV